MKRVNWKIIAAAGTALVAAGCSGGSEESETSWEEKDWEEIEEEAAGTTVELHMWGGDQGTNEYIDEWVAPRLEEQYDITLNRNPIETEDALQNLYSEKEAGTEEGTMDIIWLNGENFRNAKDNELLYGSFANALPNVEDHIDMEADTNAYDFGTPVEGMEVPWGSVQFTFMYDTEKVDTPPDSIEELAAWVEDNPGEFTYPEATDFTGNAFLRHFIYNNVEAEEVIEQGYDEEWIDEQTGSMWETLREMEPDLWRDGETYPSSLSQLDRLYRDGEVSMTMGYNEARAESLIQDGTFPETTDTFVFDNNSIGNTHYLSIPFNSTNVPGAMTAINYLVSPEAQLQKQAPSMWGDSTVLDLDTLSEDMRQEFIEQDRGDSVLDTEVLNDAYQPEMDAGYVEWTEDRWENEIVQR